MIELSVRPKEPPMTFEAFVANNVPCSIALDGFVAEGPRFSMEPLGPYWNANHHEGCSRLETRSTCAQVLMAIRQGLFDCFRTTAGSPCALVHVNDCDEDVSLSWTLLKHHHLAESTMNPALNRLVAMEDALDCTAGAYPFPVGLPMLRELAWIFEPYRQFRMSGQLDKKDARAYEGVITDVEHRILQHIAGRGGEIPVDFRYEQIGGGKDFVVVREIGAQARTGMFADGVKVFVSVRPRPDNRTTYTIGKLSPFIRLDLKYLAAHLNEAEGTVASKDQWGGADTIIGSPRVAGSGLSVETVTGLVGLT